MWNVTAMTGTVVIMFTSKSQFGFHSESSMILQCKSVTWKVILYIKKKKRKVILYIKKKKLFSKKKKSLKSLLATPNARLHQSLLLLALISLTLVPCVAYFLLLTWKWMLRQSHQFIYNKKNVNFKELSWVSLRKFHDIAM